MLTSRSPFAARRPGTFLQHPRKWLELVAPACAGERPDRSFVPGERNPRAVVAARFDQQIACLLYELLRILFADDEPVDAADAPQDTVKVQLAGLGVTALHSLGDDLGNRAQGLLVGTRRSIRQDVHHRSPQPVLMNKSK